MSDEQKAIEEILEYVASLPEPVKPSDDSPNDCASDCYDKYADCYANAGSIAEKAACKVKYNKCMDKCY